MGMKKKAAMKVMKKKAAMKAMKAMKKKSVSKVAKGVMAKAMVLRGSKAKTVGGLTAKDLTKKKSALGKKSPWIQAVAKARKALKITGFAAIKKSPRCTPRQRSSTTSERYTFTFEDGQRQVEAPAPGVGISTAAERRSPMLLPSAVTDDGRTLSTLYLLKKP